MEISEKQILEEELPTSKSTASVGDYQDKSGKSSNKGASKDKDINIQLKEARQDLRKLRQKMDSIHPRQFSTSITKGETLRLISFLNNQEHGKTISYSRSESILDKETADKIMPILYPFVELVNVVLAHKDISMNMPLEQKDEQGHWTPVLDRNGDALVRISALDRIRTEYQEMLSDPTVAAALVGLSDSIRDWRTNRGQLSPTKAVSTKSVEGHFSKKNKKKIKSSQTL